MDRLKQLLGPTPTTPWAALIPQLLMWCFRRFCVIHLADASDAALNEYVWDDMVEFVEKYAPEGLSVASKWLTPENVASVHSGLDLYNTFCMDTLLYLDAALMDDNEAVQKEMSDLLDSGLYDIFNEWIVDKELLIFPSESEDGDVMSVAKCTAIIQYLIDYSLREASDSDSDSGSGAPIDSTEYESLEPIVPQTVASAINYRRTLRNGVSRAITPSRSNHRRTRRAAKRHAKGPPPKEE